MQRAADKVKVPSETGAIDFGSGMGYSHRYLPTGHFFGQPLYLVGSYEFHGRVVEFVWYAQYLDEGSEHSGEVIDVYDR